MKCPICGGRPLPGTDRCCVCGYRIRVSPAPAPEPSRIPRPVRSVRPAPGRRRRGCGLLLLWPLIAALLSFVLSLTANIFEDVPEEVIDSSIHEEMPVPEPSADVSVPATRPAEADEGAFAIDRGVLYFLPDRWDGSPILTIPETVDGQTVTAIGPGCFRDCENLTTIILPDTVTQIRAEAFSGCRKLRGLYLPDGMKAIGKNAFAGCEDLEAICVPTSVTSIASGCFDDCINLIYILYEGSFEQWDALYGDFINPFTSAICTDGVYYHGTGR